MSLDTILNLIAVVLALAAAVGAFAAYRRSEANSRVIADNTEALATLPPKLVPTQAALDELTRQAEAVAELLKEEASRLQEYRDAIKEIAALKVANSNLAATLETKRGEVVHLTDTLYMVNGLNEKRQQEIVKLTNIIGEYARAESAWQAKLDKLTEVNAAHAANNEELRLLVERLTNALNGGKA